MSTEDPCRDVKPARGFLPSVTAAVTSHTASHGFFKVFMVVGDDDEEMLPVKVLQPQQTLTVQHFVAIPGRKFHCRIDLARQPPDGVLYGCRVYVDKGSLKSYHAFDTDSGINVLHQPLPDNVHAVQHPEPKALDFDHFFWFGPGETSYTVRGFYCSAEEEYQFQFGDLQRGQESVNAANIDKVQERRDQLGVIRFQFARVKKMVPNHESKSHTSEPPSQASDFACGALYRKGVHASVRPGKIARFGTRRSLVAQLEDNICYESVVHFNDLFGYKSARTGDPSFVDVYGLPSCLRGIPVDVFSGRPENRQFFLDKFLLWVQHGRYVVVEQRHFAHPNIGEPVPAQANSCIGTEDLVHFINMSLSPACAYILCTGKRRPGNFGEKLVQRRPRAKRDDCFQEKEDGLVAFFAIDPSNYELFENGRDQQGRRLRSVRKAQLIVMDDDSDDDE